MVSAYTLSPHSLAPFLVSGNGSLPYKFTSDLSELLVYLMLTYLLIISGYPIAFRRYLSLIINGFLYVFTGGTSQRLPNL
jgi:hypothetical protein